MYCGNFLLLVVIAGGAYKFIIQGAAVEADDGRVVIQLTATERDLVLTEMRAFLASVQQITQGIANNDMKLVATAAKKGGNSVQRDMPGALVGKLPLSFKKLGHDTHSKFDQLALDAESLGDGEHALEQLSEILQNCVACHATHRFEVSAD